MAGQINGGRGVARKCIAINDFFSASLREDTHKKVVFFCGRITKGVGRVNPPDH